MNKVNAFDNEIFNHYRETVKEINIAIELLTEHNYTVIELDGNTINKKEE